MGPMSIKQWFSKKVPEISEITAEKVLEKRRMRISDALREKLNAMDEAHEVQRSVMLPTRTEWDVVPYVPPRGVCPAKHVMAMDAATNYQQISAQFSGSGFPGYPYLTELTQLTEYRDMSERLAAEMTRKWITLSSSGDKDRTDVIKQIEAELLRLNTQERFRRMAELDGEMGRGQLFLDMGQTEGQELATPLLLSKLKVGLNKLRALKVVEPINTYPAGYNSVNPLADDYYNPSLWFVQSTQVHTSRLLTFESRPVPNMLKPAYNFSGISLSQLAQPYVDTWYDTRASVTKLLRNFSTSVLHTDMGDALSGGAGAELLSRARLFTKQRDNQGLFVIDKENENFTQSNVPLGGLEQLQAQAQEQMAAVAKTPLLILLGIAPTGLNASGEGEIRVFYDYVSECQERSFRPNLDIIIKLVMLSLFGEIYDDIHFIFNSLYQLSDKDLAGIRYSDAQAGDLYLKNGVIDRLEERQRIAAQKQSGYNNLDTSKLPPAPATAPATAPVPATATAPAPAPAPAASTTSKEAPDVQVA